MIVHGPKDPNHYNISIETPLEDHDNADISIHQSNQYEWITITRKELPEFIRTLQKINAGQQMGDHYNIPSDGTRIKD